ncbi:MAG: PAS domain S-box protein [Polaromonas sp.]|uniref:PAS domain-containing sensor histidine kinase n=1 Tax=Polaromonas sp. TaxID=1869339 RepID=UPI0027328912|nr:PAS domain S-box protein [Polaromonas sp.]MDP3247361.1 PAS domain S-box protein [Polaromonas sp.]
MSDTSSPESTRLLAAALIEQRYSRGLRSLLLMLLISLPLVLGLTLVQESGDVQIGVIAVSLALTAFGYWLLHHGHYQWTTYLLVYSLIGVSAAGMVAYGSVRSTLLLGFVGAVIAAGLMQGKKSLISAVVLSSLVLGLLCWAELAGLLGQADFTVDLRFWVISVLMLTGIAGSVYTSRQVVLRALREQHAELRRREKAENELRLSEDRFSRIFRNSPAAIIVQDLEAMTVLDVNPAFERLWGYSRAESIGGTDVHLWSDPAARRAFQRQMAATGRAINLPLEGRRKDGRLINVLLSTEFEGRGKGRIVVSTITDATAETQARQAARQSAELFSKAFDFSPINMTITRVADGTFLAANAAEDRIHGFEPEELVGRTSVEIGVWPSEAERSQFVQDLQAGGRVLSREMKMRHKNGGMVDCRVWSAIIDIAGEPCMLNSTINISEQKRREAQLIDVAKALSVGTGEAFFRSVVQHLALAIGADLVIVGETMADQSVASLAMVQDGELQPDIRYALAGTPCDKVLSQSDLCVYNEGLQQLFPNDRILVEGNFHAYVGAALRDADGTPIGVVNALWRKPQARSTDRDALMQIFASRIAAELVRLRRDREISRFNETLEQRVNERTEQLMATNAELESFGYSVSHDLQSPLRSIEGFSVLLARRLKGRLSDEEQRLFDRVRVNVVRMHELINDLLALARVSKGKLVLEEVDLSVMAQQVVMQERQRDPKRPVQVIIQPGIRGQCDSKLARIILENLIGNAWKYSRQQPDAMIEFGLMPAREGGRKMLFVRDNGTGFNMAYADSLFKPFHRLHHDTEFEGSGIGLATVHRILERHGGLIRGESSEGAGACFYFSFDSRVGAIAA